MILHAQLEIWKAAYSDEDLNMQWQPDTTSSNASSGDISEGKPQTHIIPKNILISKIFINSVYNLNL